MQYKVPYSDCNGSRKETIDSPLAITVFIEPAPYITSLVNELRKQWPGSVSTWFIASAASQKWENVSCGPNSHYLPRGRLTALAVLWREIITRKPKIVFVAGWSHPLIIASIIMAHVSGAKVVAMSDTWVVNKKHLRTLAKRTLFSMIDRFCPGGQRQARYLKAYGVEARRVFLGQMTVDTFALGNFIANEGPGQRRKIRGELGISENTIVFLFVGRLEPVKGPDLALKAFSTLPRDARVRLLFVGDGSLRSMVEAAAASDERVVYCGRLEGDALWTKYATADVLVAPSRSEPWGLVVNEALAAGLPVVVTDCFGCIDDLISDGKNGLVVENSKPAALSNALSSFLSDPKRLRKMKSQAKQSIYGWTSEGWARNIAATWLDALR